MGARPIAVPDGAPERGSTSSVQVHEPPKRQKPPPCCTRDPGNGGSGSHPSSLLRKRAQGCLPPMIALATEVVGLFAEKGRVEPDLGLLTSYGTLVHVG